MMKGNIDINYVNVSIFAILLIGSDRDKFEKYKTPGLIQHDNQIRDGQRDKRGRFHIRRFRHLR
jgi:hypothetical protein